MSKDYKNSLTIFSRLIFLPSNFKKITFLPSNKSNFLCLIWSGPLEKLLFSWSWEAEEWEISRIPICAGDWAECKRLCPHRHRFWGRPAEENIRKVSIVRQLGFGVSQSAPLWHHLPPLSDVQVSHVAKPSDCFLFLWKRYLWCRVQVTGIWMGFSFTGISYIL